MEKIQLVATLFSVGAFLLLGGIATATENAVYVINNIAPNYSTRGGYGGGVMCTDDGGICTNGRYMLFTSRVRYSPPLWKNPTIRERRLSEGKERLPYAYTHPTYYR